MQVFGNQTAGNPTSTELHHRISDSCADVQDVHNIYVDLYNQMVDRLGEQNDTVLLVSLANTEMLECIGEMSFMFTREKQAFNNRIKISTDDGIKKLIVDSLEKWQRWNKNGQ